MYPVMRGDNIPGRVPFEKKTCHFKIRPLVRLFQKYQLLPAVFEIPIKIDENCGAMSK